MREQLVGIHACISGRERQRLIAFLTLVQRNNTTTPRLTRGGSQLHFATKRAFDFIQDCHHRECSSASSIRSDVCPSQSGGCWTHVFDVPLRLSFAAAMLFVVSVPTMTKNIPAAN